MFILGPDLRKLDKSSQKSVHSDSWTQFSALISLILIFNHEENQVAKMTSQFLISGRVPSTIEIPIVKAAHCLLAARDFAL